MQPNDPYSYQPGTDIQAPMQEYYTGLEDFDPSDARLGRLTIKHKNTPQVFADSLTGEEFPVIDIIPLAFVKARVLWFPEMDENASPLCKSTDNKTGYPAPRDRDPKKNFPEQASGLNILDMPLNPENGRAMASCEACQLRQWGSHPNIGKKQPWCAEQRVIPMLYGAPGEVPSNLVVITFQSTSLVPVNQFFAGISRSKVRTATGAEMQMPAYAVSARLTLQERKKGSNIFAVPAFQKLEPTDVKDWNSYADYAQSAATLLRRAPRNDDPEFEKPVDDYEAGTYSPPTSHNPGMTVSAPPIVQQNTMPPRVVESYVVQQPVTHPAAPITPMQPAQAAPIAPVAPQPQQPAPVQQQVADPWGATPVQPDPWPVNNPAPQQPVQPVQSSMPSSPDEEGLPF